MKTRALIAFMATLFLALAIPSQAPAQNTAPENASGTPSGLTTAEATTLKANLETYLRKLYAWGPSFELKIGPITTGPADFYSVPVQVTLHGRSDSAVVYVSKDGRYLFRGDVNDMNSDPFAKIRKQLTVTGYGSKGPADAKVVLVEFADFECPSCRALDTILRAVLPKYTQVRLVFKDFPLQQIHPWAMTAAIASHCVLQKGSAAFWKFHDSVYDDQDEIMPDNAYDKLTQLAVAAGANADDLHACMANRNTRKVVESSIQQGKDLDITGTPTTFVNGRRLLGPNQKLLQQYIDYELHSPATPDTTQQNIH